jgi:hypothetical protein
VGEQPRQLGWLRRRRRQSAPGKRGSRWRGVSRRRRDRWEQWGRERRPRCVAEAASGAAGAGVAACSAWLRRSAAVLVGEVAAAHIARLSSSGLLRRRDWQRTQRRAAHVRNRGAGVLAVLGGGGGCWWRSTIRGDRLGAAGDGSGVVGAQAGGGAVRSADAKLARESPKRARVNAWTGGVRGREDDRRGLRLVRGRSLNFLSLR